MTLQMLHGTAVAIDGYGVLLIGPSGSGKSDLAIRLIDRGATLVSDDIVAIGEAGGMPVLGEAPNIAGKIELRGIGICKAETISSAPLRLVGELISEVDRMPQAGLTMKVGEFDVPLVRLVPFEASAPIKLEYALRATVDAAFLPTMAQLVSTAGDEI